MCGIAGFVGEFKKSEENLHLMLSSIEHRGPDDQRTFFDKPFYGGMRRLSINDLEGGSQPLLNQKYNFIMARFIIINLCDLISKAKILPLRHLLMEK